MARVTVKNRAHAALNPKAHLRKTVTIEDVFASRYISWPIKLLDACPQSSGGCAMVLASERYIRRTSSRRCGSPAWRTARRATYIGDRMGNGFTADHADAHALARIVRARLPHGRDQRSGEAGARRRALRAVLATPSSTRSRRRASPGMGKSMAMLREGAFHIGSPHRGQPVGRDAVHQRDRSVRDGARGGSGAAGLGPRRRAPAAKGAQSRSPAATAATTSSSARWSSKRRRQGRHRDGTAHAQGILEHRLRRTRSARPRAGSSCRSATTRRSTAGAIRSRAACWCRRARSPTRRSSRRPNGSRSGRAGGSRLHDRLRGVQDAARPAVRLRLRAARRRRHRASAASSAASIWPIPAKAAAKLKVGTRVITRFADERTGDVLDFWFELENVEQATVGWQ